MKKPLPTPEELRALLRYDPETGKMHWLPRPREMFATERDARAWNTRYANAEAFLTPHRDGYRQGAIHDRKYFAHRVAWALHHSEWPQDEIDHINGVRDDNRLENLRAVSRTVNSRNTSMSPRNTSGYNGVCWEKDRRKWQARIHIDGKFKHLGYFDDVNDAIAARRAADREHGFTERHGLDNLHTEER